MGNCQVQNIRLSRGYICISRTKLIILSPVITKASNCRRPRPPFDGCRSAGSNARIFVADIVGGADVLRELVVVKVFVSTNVFFVEICCCWYCCCCCCWYCCCCCCCCSSCRSGCRLQPTTGMWVFGGEGALERRGFGGVHSIWNKMVITLQIVPWIN